MAAHQTNRANKHLTPDLPTVAELLKNAGYRTVGFSNNAHASSHFGFDRGFSQFHDNLEAYNEPLNSKIRISNLRRNVDEDRLFKQIIEALKYIRERDGSITRTSANWIFRKANEVGLITGEDRGAKSTNQFIDDFLADRDETPFFVFTNYMEAHAPYQSPDEYQFKYVNQPTVSSWGKQSDYFAQRVDNQKKKVHDLQDQYDGCIRYLDSQLENLIELLEAYGVLEDTHVIITSDHGEAFGEHGLYEHKSGVFDELTHVPLIWNPPRDENQEISTPVSIRWLYPSILSLTNIDPPDTCRKVTLRDAPREPVIIESEGIPYDDVFSGSLSKKFASSQWAYLTEGLKLVRYDFSDTTELYALGDEQVDLSSQRREIASTMESDLLAELQRYSRPQRSDSDDEFEIDEVTEEHLKQLGYR